METFFIGKIKKIKIFILKQTKEGNEWSKLCFFEEEGTGEGKNIGIEKIKIT